MAAESTGLYFSGSCILVVSLKTVKNASFMLKHSIMLWGRAPKAKYLALGRRRDLSNGKKKEDATALLSVLESSYSNPDQSKGRNAAATKDNNPKGKVENKANRAKSFFDEVDSFLEEQRREKGGGSEFSNFASSSNLFGKKTYEKSANGSSQSKPAAESSRSRKWTSYLPKEDEDSLNEKSIFDVFKVPEPVPERNPNAFDLDAYNAFCSLLNEYFDAESKKSSKLADELSHEMKQDVRRWIQKEEHQNLINLPTLNQLFQDELIKNGTLINLLQAKSDAKKEIRKQSTNFRKHLAWSNNQYKYAVKVLRELSKLSAQQNKAHPVVVIWEKLKEAGYLTNTTIGHCLQACNSFSAISLSRNRRTFASSALNNRLSGLLQHDSKGNVGDAEEETIATVPEQLAITNDLLYEPTNQTISIQLRRSVSLGDAKGAFGFAEAIQVRTYCVCLKSSIEYGLLNIPILRSHPCRTMQTKPVPTYLFLGYSLSLAISIPHISYFKR
mgnify:CR=1 FL=1